MDAVYKLLTDAGLMYTQKVSSTFIGVHPSNRDGCGVSTKHVHDLLADLVSLGWSQSEFKGLCVEVSDSERSSVYQWNKELVDNSDGQLPDFPSEAHVKYATIGGSHTNQVLRCFLSKVPSSAVGVTDGARLSLNRLQELDRDFWTACTEGATWRVISGIVPERFPSFCGLAQSAANASGHVAREESELQLCRKIHTEVAKAYQAGKTTVTYQDVKEAVLRSKPRAAATVPALFLFTLRYSGGQAQLRHMILHFAYAIDEARSLTGSDIKKLLGLSMVGKVAHATALLSKCRELCTNNSVPAAISLKYLGFLQVHIIAILLEKKKIMKQETVEKAAEECINEILRETKMTFENPFKHSSSEGSSSRSPSGKTTKEEQGLVPLVG
ncbi:unnamed protein product, partial [Symbiodinium sp. CCMP2456]